MASLKEIIATKRALETSDNLHLIFEHLENEDLLACALTCQIWTPVALDGLWKDLNSVLPLLLLMSPLKSVKDNDETKWVNITLYQNLACER